MLPDSVTRLDVTLSRLWYHLVQGLFHRIQDHRLEVLKYRPRHIIHTIISKRNLLPSILYVYTKFTSATGCFNPLPLHTFPNRFRSFNRVDGISTTVHSVPYTFINVVRNSVRVWNTKLLSCLISSCALMKSCTRQVDQKHIRAHVVSSIKAKLC